MSARTVPTMTPTQQAHAAALHHLETTARNVAISTLLLTAAVRHAHEQGRTVDSCLLAAGCYLQLVRDREAAEAARAAEVTARAAIADAARRLPTATGS